MIQNILLSLYVCVNLRKKYTKMLTEVILGGGIIGSFAFLILLKISKFAVMNVYHYYKFLNDQGFVWNLLGVYEKDVCYVIPKFPEEVKYFMYTLFHYS